MIPLERAAEREILASVREEMDSLFGQRGAPLAPDEERLAELVRTAIARWQRSRVNSNLAVLPDVAVMEERIMNWLVRLGPLEPLIRNPVYEEIFVDSPREVGVIERTGRTVMLPDVYFESDEEVRELAKRALAAVGRRVDEASPMVDARLADGSRLNVVIPPVSQQYTVLTIRTFRPDVDTLDRLVELGTIGQDLVVFLRAAVHAYLNIVVSGPTGSGKCLTGETAVNLCDGDRRPIRELVEGAFRRTAPITGSDGWESAPLNSDDVGILTHDFDSGETRPALGVVAWRHRAPTTLFEVVLRGGDVLRVTPEHPFFTIVDGLVCPVRADALRPGVRLATLTALPSEGQLPSLPELLSASDRLYAANVSPVVRRAFKLVRQREALCDLAAVDAALGLARRRAGAWRRRPQSSNAVPLKELRRLFDRAGLAFAFPRRRLIVKGKTATGGWQVPNIPPIELSRFAGLIVGDGLVGHAYVELTSGDADVRADFQRLCERFFQQSPQDPPPGTRCPRLRLSSVAAVEVLRLAYGVPEGAKARSVRAPQWLFAGGADHIAAFLSGVLDTDGSVLNQGGTAWLVEFCTASHGLANDIRGLLLRLGARCRVVRQDRANGPHYVVWVRDHASLQRLQRVLRLRHSRRRRVLASIKHTRPSSMRDILPELAQPLRQARLAAGMSMVEAATAMGISEKVLWAYESGARPVTRTAALRIARAGGSLGEPVRGLLAQPVFWDTVLAVNELHEHGEAHVYDLTVPGTHNFLVGAGAAVAHNTTLLNALGNETDGTGRMIVIEQTRELKLPDLVPLCVSLEAQEENAEGVGEIEQRELVRNALRMRPRRIIVGETRGAETWDMLRAMNTGHGGCLSSVHANSPRDALDALITLGMMAPERPPEGVMARLIARSISLVIQMAEEPGTGRRLLTNVFEITGLEGNTIQGHDLWLRDEVSGRLEWTGTPPKCVAEFARKGVPYMVPSAPVLSGTNGVRA